MIVDGLNMFLRAFIVDPSLSTNGDPVGGIKGTFKILQKMVGLVKPSEIIIAWDGPNGSRRRKEMNKAYKDGRAPIRINRDIENFSEEDLQLNKIWQQTTLIEYLNKTPVMQIMMPEIEADDIISYVCSMPHYVDHQKVIISNDKDFLQLCDDKTVIFRPVKNHFINKKNIIDEYGIHPVNMALARAIIGDASDNLPGVKGAGFKTVAKHMTFLSDEKVATIDDVIHFCSTTDKKIKVLKEIAISESIIEDNYKIMQLYSPQMSIQAKQFVEESIQNFEFSFEYFDLLRAFKKDNMGNFEWIELKKYFDNIVKYHC